MINKIKRIALAMLLLMASTAMAYAQRVDYEALKKNKAVEIVEISGQMARMGAPEEVDLSSLDKMYICSSEKSEGVKELRKAFASVLSGKDKQISLLVDVPRGDERTRIFQELKPNKTEEYSAIYIVQEEKNEINIIVFLGNFTKESLAKMSGLVND